MAMNFWKAQARARGKTKVYITLFVIITLIVTVICEWALRTYAEDSYQPDFPIFGTFFIAITFLVALVNYAIYTQQGGAYVAETLGGIKINPLSVNHPAEKQLLNIVEEIALASSLPVPEIYILPVNEINAFAAGTTPKNAAIAISAGALNKLNRDEIQGVIAHEFGHIYNGDMKISMRLAAMVMGFFFVIYIALRILQFSGLSGRSKSSDQRGGNPIAIAALILIVAGAFTWLAGSILKACVSREREYLADACSVQFTRNPDGIANALRKIGKDQTRDMPREGAAYSHLYFSEGINSIFATHPPLEKRIAAIEGREYLPEEWKKGLDDKSTHDINRI